MAVLCSEVVSQGQLDFGELVSIEEADGVAYDVGDIDRPDLVDKHARRSTPDLQPRAVDRTPSRARGGDDSHDRERRVRWRHHQPQAPAALLMTSWPSQVDSVYGSANHQISGSALRFSSFSTSASARNCSSHRS